MDEKMKEIASFVAAKVGEIRHHSFLVTDIISAERQRVSDGFSYKMDLKIEVTKIKMLWVLDCNVVVFDPFPRLKAKSSRLPVVPRQLVQCSCCGSSWKAPELIQPPIISTDATIVSSTEQIQLHICLLFCCGND